MLTYLHPDNPQKRELKRISEDLAVGKIKILPTDTVYAFVTALGNKKSIANIYNMKNISYSKPLSLYCKDFSQADQFIKMPSNQAFRWMKSHLPGPYTLVFRASKNLPQYTLTRQKTVGVRIINHPVIQGILEFLDTPLIGSSVSNEGLYYHYPDDLDEVYGKRVSEIVDGGISELEFSTILDATGFPFEVIREGKGLIDF
jgi:tRNA threonylcarbamoyl adenosine modification protein (Sua5/YciO/YrdC/YwlC family)